MPSLLLSLIPKSLRRQTKAGDVSLVSYGQQLPASFNLVHRTELVNLWLALFRDALWCGASNSARDILFRQSALQDGRGEGEKNGSSIGQCILIDYNGKHVTEIDAVTIINADIGWKVTFSTRLYLQKVVA